MIIVTNSQWVGNFLDRKISRGRTVIQDQRVYEWEQYFIVLLDMFICTYWFEIYMIYPERECYL